MTRSLRLSKRPRRSLRVPQGTGEAGAATVVTVAMMAAVVSLTAMALPLYSVLVVRQSVAAAADAAALAAADVAVGRAAGSPCEVAARVAIANGASLTSCELDGLVATVAASRLMLGFELSAWATAGPPRGEPD